MKTQIYVLSIFLAFITTVCATILAIYSNALFLSKYPEGLIYQYLIALAIIRMGESYFMSLFLGNRVKFNVTIMNILCVLTLFITFFLNFIDHYWTTAVISVLLYAVSYFISTSFFSIITLVFGIRAYKENVSLFILFISIGTILASFYTAWLLKYDNSSLIYLTSLLSTIFVTISTLFLPIQEDPKTKKDIKAAPMKFNLFRNLIVFVIATSITVALADYLFNFYVSENIPKDQIGVFLGNFSGIVNIASLLLAILTTKKLMHFLRIDGILYETPVLYLILSPLCIFFPSIISISLLASIKQVFYILHTQIGTDFTINILPSAPRTVGKLQIKFVKNGISIIALLLPLLFTNNQMIIGVSLFIIGFAIIACKYVPKIFSSYKTTLQQEIEFKRFNLIDEINEINAPTFDELANTALASTDVRSILFGLNVLDKLKTNQLYKKEDDDRNKSNKNIYPLLTHKEVIVRKASIDIIQKNKDNNAIPYLLELIQNEKNPEIIFKAFACLSQIDTIANKNIFREKLDNKSDYLYPLAIGVLLSEQDNYGKSYSIAELKKLSSNKNPLIRRVTAFTIGQFNIKELEQELRLLIFDSDTQVSQEAVRAAGSSHMFSLVPLIIEQISSKSLRSNAHSTLVSMGKEVIPILLEQLNNPKLTSQIIRVIAHIPDAESESVLLNLAQDSSVLIKTYVAKAVNYRASNTEISTDFIQKASEIALEESYNVAYLQNLLLTYPNPPLYTEIESRIQLAKERTLYWCSVATEPKLFSRLIPILLSSSSKPEFLNAKDKAYELLDFYVKNPILLKSITLIFESGLKSKIPLKSETKYIDNWLQTLFKWQATIS